MLGQKYDACFEEKKKRSHFSARKTFTYTIKTTILPLNLTTKYFHTYIYIHTQKQKQWHEWSVKQVMQALVNTDIGDSSLSLS